MRKLIFQNMITLDGFFEGPDREIDWHNVDDEFNSIAIEFLNTIDLLIFGRVTYELMASYWPTPAALNDDPVISKLMNKIQKIVFSRTLKKAEWENTRLFNNNLVKEITELKKLPGKDMAIFGSSDLSLELIKNNLIDEFRIMVSPVAIGKGKAIFSGIKERLKFELLNSLSFRSGNVLMVYRQVK
jgi:dihydrofolate reductase